MPVSQRQECYFFADAYWNTCAVLEALAAHFEVPTECCWEHAVFIRCHKYMHGEQVNTCRASADVGEFRVSGVLPYNVRFTAYDLAKEYKIDPVKLRASRPQAAE